MELSIWDFLEIARGKSMEKIISDLEFASNMLTAVDIVEMSDSEAGRKLIEIKEQLDQGIEWLKLPGTVIENVDLVVEIYSAVGDLRGPITRHNNVKQAKAFGRLFKAMGHYVGFLPPPLSAWKNFFEGAQDFFVNMLQAIDPATRATNRHEINRWKQAGVDLDM